MSNSASISAAKKRRGGTPPMMGNVGGGPGMNLPPGLPPNFRQLPPQVQQQLFMQLQQRAAANAKMSQASQSQQQPHQTVSMPPAPIQTRAPMPPGVVLGNNAGPVPIPGPYTVNPVIHNRAVAEVNGIHIRDLPISSAGLPCLPSGAALPPNVLFKLHHDELLNMDAVLNEHSNRIQMFVNRLDKVERLNGVSMGGVNNGFDSSGSGSRNNTTGDNIESSSYDKLVNNTEFITKLLDNILTNTNLSDIINQIEPLQKENELLRGLLNSQQTTLNELSGLVRKLLTNGLPSYCEGNNDKGDSNDQQDNMNGGEAGGGAILSHVYNSYEGQYNEQENMETNYVCDSMNGVYTTSVDNVEEIQDGDCKNEEEENDTNSETEA